MKLTTDNLRKDYATVINNILQNVYNIPYKYLPCDYERSVIMFSKILRRRIYINRKWKVIQHPELTITPDLQKGFEALIHALEQGKDIEKFMTTTIYDPNFSDMMLDCEEIYHFHLSSLPHKTNPMFNERTNERAFVYMDLNNSMAYIIDIYKHGAEQNLIQDRIKKLWEHYPEACKANVQEGKLTVQITDKNGSELRGIGINPIFQLDENHIFVPNGGVSTDGTAVKDSLYLVQTNRLLYKLESIIKDYLLQFDRNNIDDFDI